jgi:hypothetical protein
MGWTRWPKERFQLSLWQNKELWTIVILSVMAICSPLLSEEIKPQFRIMYSNGNLSVNEYEGIPYPKLARIAGLGMEYSLDLTILPGGKVAHYFQKPKYREPSNNVYFYFQQAIESAVKRWRFENITDQNIYIELKVQFELKGTVGDPDEDTTCINKIIMNQDGIAVKVVASRIIYYAR